MEKYPERSYQSNEFYGDFSMDFTGVHTQRNDNVIGEMIRPRENIIHDLKVWRVLCQ